MPPSAVLTSPSRCVKASSNIRTITSAATHPELQEYRLDERPPLEAQLIDVADEIAYNCADLDDGYESKLLSLPAIRSTLPLFGRIYRSMEKEYPEVKEKLRFNETLKRLLNAFVTDLIDPRAGGWRRTESARWRRFAQCRTRLVALGPRMMREIRR